MTKSQKILCSVSILTLNSAQGLPACLESLKDFAEIIVCDGNSTDDTRAIAQRYGAKIISQYDTDEPETPCAMDKAGRRQRAMQASTLPWRFFMDADDTLSPEAVEEIRRITTQDSPHHLVWRMPTRVFIAGREIKHEATYPSYQTRLVHETVGAHFRGLVHDRLAFNEQRFPVGTMHNHYNFHWPPERVANYWGYLGAYARRELQVMEVPTLGNLLYWGLYRRLRTILGYVLWRLPVMYLRWGFKSSMPLSIELTIVRYHLYIFFGTIGLYFKTRMWFTYLVETLKGKDLNRMLCNVAAREWEAYGKVLDLGGDGSSSYWRFMKHHRWHKVITVDIDAKAKPDIILDFDRQELPFEAEYFDTVIMSNVLEHLAHGEEVLTKVHRVMRKGATLCGVVPFLVGVHPNPHDYARYTREGLEQILASAGFSAIEIAAIGRGPFSASYYQVEFMVPRLLKLFLLPLTLLLDGLVLAVRPSLREKFPLSYAWRAQR